MRKFGKGFGAVVATGIAALAVVGGASAAGGMHNVSITNNVHGVQPSFTDVNPCTGDAIVISPTSNIVEHITFFPATDEAWARSRRRTA